MSDSESRESIFNDPKFILASETSSHINAFLTDFLEDQRFNKLTPEQMAAIISKELTKLSDPKKLEMFLAQRDEK